MNLKSELKSESLQRVLVRGTNWVGDAVITVPALKRLRWLLPKAHITLATRPLTKDLFAGASFIDDLIILEARGLWSTFSEARDFASRNFDLAILFPNSFQTALTAALARIPFRVGYQSERRGFLLTRAISQPEWRASRHEVFYYLHLIDELQKMIGDNREAPSPDASVNVPVTDRERARKILIESGVNESNPTIALCPGSINSRAKRWPVERYAALADRLIDALKANVLLIGSAGELDVTNAVISLMTQKPIVLTGRTDLAELVGVLNEVDLLITNDTGPAHIASSLGRPTIVIFGPTNPLTTRPFAEDAVVLRHPPDCAPCMLRDCPIDHRCMTAISPDEVFAKAEAMLSRVAVNLRPVAELKQA